jgi:SAM-dependent methyltransferase
VNCYVCDDSRLIKLLDKQPIPLWTGYGSVKVLPLSRCRLYQCKGCGHIQQNMDNGLEKKLKMIYRSSHAQVSTEIGKGNWGGRRARLIKAILSEFGLMDLDSALEIGCAGGYLLRYLKSRGFNNLAGVDPSLRKTGNKNGIFYLKNHASLDTVFNRSFDLIISLCAFEHIKDVNAVIETCVSHLADKGSLFFEVPDHRAQLEKGDPAVFLHEHIHYYTPSSLKTLLENHGLKICKVKEAFDSYFILAKRMEKSAASRAKVVLYKNYAGKLDAVIKYAAAMANGKKNIAFHGVCSGLHNILHWASLRTDFGLFDNDQAKIGKTFFGKKVFLPNLKMIKKYERILVVPLVYSKEIIRQYKAMGYKGEIRPILKNA